MKSHPFKITRFLLLALVLFISACSNSDSTKTEEKKQNDPQLIGTWQQTAIGKDKVSGIVVKIIFSGSTLTMDAPGCLIIGDYTTEDNVFTYTVTSVQGERCAGTQKIGTSDKVGYRIDGSKLLLKPVSAGEEAQTEYERIIDNPHP